MKKHSVKRAGKMLALVLSIVLILVLAAGSTLAYVFTKTDALENLFRHSQVTCRVNYSGQVADVTNTGNIDAYIRAAVTVNWVNADGDIRGIKPTESQYSLAFNTEDWYAIDGIWYCLTPVAVGANTPDLITGVTVLEQPDGYQLQVEVAAEAIQAQGVNATGVYAFAEAWKVSIPEVQP